MTSSLIRKYGDTDFITGLRAIAATLVVIIHAGAFQSFGIIGENVTSAGKYGVDIFFVISGFTIAKTFTESVSYRAYLTRRMLRILPLYWVLISVALLMAIGGVEISGWASDLGAKPDLYNFAMHILMISYLDYRVANSVLGVEWSIPIEVFWYICLPFLLTFAKSIPRVLIAVVVMALLTGVFSYVSKKVIGTSLPIKWSPIAYGHLFVIGAFTFFIRDRVQLNLRPRNHAFVYGAAIAIILSLAIKYSGRGEVIALMTAVLLVFLSAKTPGPLVPVLTSWPLLFVGSVSYSVYLIHPLSIAVLRPVLGPDSAPLMFFLSVYALTLLLSVMTFLWIERPTNALGRKLAR